jgi:hypothetical protein
MRHFVMCDTAAHRRHPYTNKRYDELGSYFVMNTETDVAPLIELLKMADERWPRSGSGQVSQSDLLRRDHSLLEMWPEACRRAGVGGREFPAGVIKLWKQSLGRVN